MANNPVATMTARVEIDKAKAVEEAVKDIKEIQKVVDGNAIVYKLKGDKGSLKQFIKEIGEKDFKVGVDIVLTAKAKDLQTQINELMGGAKVEIDSSAITEIDKQIKTTSKDLEAAKKNLAKLGGGNDIASLKKKLADINQELNLNTKLTGKKYDAKAKEFLDIAETLAAAGEKDFLKSDNLASTLSELGKFYIKGQKYKPINLLADSSLDNVREAQERVDSLTSKLQDLQQQRALAIQGGQAASGAAALEGAANQLGNEVRDITETVNSVKALLGKSFETSGKKAATSQLKEAYAEYQKYFGESGEDAAKTAVWEWSEAGRQAAFNYVNSLREGLRQGIAQSSLEKYVPDDLKYLLGKNEKTRNTNIDSAFEDVESYLKEKARILEELGNPKLSSQAMADLDSYLHFWEQLRLNSNNFEIMDDSVADDIALMENAKTILQQTIAYERELGEASRQAGNEATSSTQAQIDAEQRLQDSANAAASDVVNNQNRIQDAVNETTAEVNELNAAMRNTGEGATTPVTPANAPKLVTEPSGQMALFEGVAEAEMHVVENAEKVSASLDQIEGQLSLVFLNSPENVTAAYAQWAEELEKVEGNADDVAKAIQNAINITKAQDSRGFAVEELSKLHEYEVGLESLPWYYEKIEKYKESTIETEQKFWDAIYKRDEANRKKLDSMSGDALGLQDSQKYIDDITLRAKDLSAVIEELQSQPFVNEESLKEAQKLLQQLKKDASSDDAQWANPRKVSNVVDQISQYMTKYTALSKETKKSLQEISDAFQNPNLTKAGANALLNQFIKIKTAAREAGEETQSIFTTIGNRLKDMNAKFIAQFFSFQDIIRYIRQISQYVIELDTALTELRKVSDASTERLSQSFEKSAATAQELGQSIQHVISVTADWARLNKLGLFA